VAKRVPPDLLSQPGELRSPFDLRLLLAFLVVRPPCDRIGKNPIGISREE
jgi:hypothetical protein